ncbi:MAG: 50S ribosomal protein L11 methyltransferase [Firmicutes bacterium]|jgi:ribosomal protein L11 methyltransferase|nr:50S ribosomal protein L11 methyltransferase [Bacillota bacterium]
MEYLEARVYTTTKGIDPVSGVFLAAGVEGIVVEDPGDFYELMEKKNAYDWDYVDEDLVKELKSKETNVTAYLEKTPEGYAQLKRIDEEIWRLATLDACAAFEDTVCLFGRLKLCVRTVDDNDWKDNWKEYFKPVKVTDRIVIKPSWEDYEKQEGEIVIEIDPGAAFGTGKHPTTTMCIKALEKYIRPGESTVLDVGCGSGILSIAAALLGARDVLGIDIDPLAVTVSKENAAFNKLEDRIRIVEGDLTKGVDYKADIVAANLMADLVVLLAADVRRHLNPGGLYVSSGILAEKKDEVAGKIREAGFEITEIYEEEEWVCIVAR